MREIRGTYTRDMTISVDIQDLMNIVERAITENCENFDVEDVRLEDTSIVVTGQMRDRAKSLMTEGNYHPEEAGDPPEWDIDVDETEIDDEEIDEYIRQDLKGLRLSSIVVENPNGSFEPYDMDDTDDWDDVDDWEDE